MKKFAVLLVILALVAAAVVHAAPRKRGAIKLTAKGLVLEMDFGQKQKLIVTSRAKRLRVGTYTPVSYTLMKRAKSGKIYKLESRKVTGATPWSFKVEEGETTELDIGPPLKIVPIEYVSGVSRTGQRTIPVGYRILGKQGEQYQHGIRMGARRLPAPAYQIEDGNGKVLASGKFEYG